MLQRTLSKRVELAYALMRAVTGLNFAVHGAQKLFGVWGGRVPPFGSQLWIGAVIELVAGVAVALGFRTVWAAFLASGTMAVAYVQYHWAFRFDEKFLPQLNKGELALVYCLVFLFIACRGPGTYSLDRRS